MNTQKRSLQGLVEKWLAPTPAVPAHVTQFGRTAAGNTRFICVEVSHPTNPRALFFFRHGDGCWRVFPPPDERPAMSYRQAA
ncbi:hypothetical protein [Paraburkholderia oxyphila]|uniref:hypothetical protein n=1 Tax=Paraburkholderia oxyphila TaxID=614212 RepID=UPI0004879A83|nr:hypothetical protein [Paraburkholderia oxyphila]